MTSATIKPTATSPTVTHLLGHGYYDSYRNLGKPVYSYLHMLWVKGHQDCYLTYEKLSTQAKTNIRADEFVEQYRESNQGQHRAQALSQPCNEPIPGQ
jgi:hypothetical protein